MFLSVSEFARHRSVSVESVSQAITDLRITREPDGSINVEQADLDWERNTRKARRDPTVDAKAGLKRSTTWAKKNAAKAEIVAADPKLLETNAMSYADARAYKENLDARMKQIELAQRQGSVVPSAAVAESVENLFRVHRDAILNIPNRVAAQVFEQASIADVHALLESELRASLEELSLALAQIANRQTSINPRPARSS